MAAFSKLFPASSSRQRSRTSRGPTPVFQGASALASIPVPSNRAACRAGAAGRSPPGPAPGPRLSCSQDRATARPAGHPTAFPGLAESPPPAAPQCGCQPVPFTGAVQQRSRACPERRQRNPLLVAGDHRVGAGALLHRVPVVTTRAGVHRAEKHKVFTTDPWRSCFLPCLSWLARQKAALDP
jgi:hypothetical protein